MQLNKQSNNKKSRNPKNPQNKPTGGLIYLNLIYLSEYPDNSISLITSMIASNNCVIVNTRITELGKDMACLALIRGKWHDILKLESALSSLIKKLNLNMQIKRNNFVTPLIPVEIEQTNNYINYIARVTTINKSELLDLLLQFFDKENISIKEVNISSVSPYSNLINLDIQIKIHTDTHINSLREEFLNYCDNLNLDISLEPFTLS